MAKNSSRHPTAARARPTARPGEYRRPWPADWWLRRPSYFLFMLREFTALFVGAYALLLLILAALGRDAFAAVVQSPLNMVLHGIALPMVLYHTVTWLNLTPKVIVLWRGEERVSPRLIAAAHYAAWLVLSAVLVGLALSIA
jgi:fumarate reductase subunit C